jgi:hypothetical protein
MNDRIDVTKVHAQHETMAVDVNIPGHEPRATTALFRRSREQLIAREGGRCWVSGLTAEQLGAPLEAHHHPIERSMANMIDWQRFATDCKAGIWGPHAKGFDWDGFFEGATTQRVEVPAQDGEEAYTVTLVIPRDPYLFVDDMTVNGLLLGKEYHTGLNEGIHRLPFPYWIARKYGREGYVFSSVETIHNARFQPE